MSRHIDFTVYTTVLNEIRLWSKIFFKGGLIKCDVFLSRPKWLQMLRSTIFPSFLVGLFIFWYKQLFAQNLTKLYLHALKVVLRIV